MIWCDAWQQPRLVPPPHGRQERLVATTMDGSVALLDVAAGTMLATVQPHRKYIIKAVCIQAGNETLIVTGSWVR